MPEGRTWVVSGDASGTWEVRTAREREVYFRPVDSSGVATGGWRPGLPSLEDTSTLPESLREVLQIFAEASECDASTEEEPR